jgi:hypothetical protein
LTESSLNFAFEWIMGVLAFLKMMNLNCIVLDASFQRFVV